MYSPLVSFSSSFQILWTNQIPIFSTTIKHLRLFSLHRRQNKGAYYHLCFVRGQPSLVRNMVRRKIKGNKHSLREKKVQHNFYDPAWENHKSDSVPPALQTGDNHFSVDCHRVSIDSYSATMYSYRDSVQSNSMSVQSIRTSIQGKRASIDDYRASQIACASQSFSAPPSAAASSTKKRPSIVIERSDSDNHLPLFEDTVPCAPLLVKATSNDFSRFADACASVISKEDAWECSSMAEDEIDKACRATAARFVAPQLPGRNLLSSRHRPPPSPVQSRYQLRKLLPVLFPLPSKCHQLPFLLSSL